MLPVLIATLALILASAQAENTVCTWQPDRQQPGKHGFVHYCSASYHGNKTRGSYNCDPNSESGPNIEVATYGTPGPGVVFISEFA